MNILQVIDHMPSTSGGSRLVTDLSVFLKKKGHNVDVLLIDGTPSSFIEELKLNDINVYSIGVGINRYNFLNAYKIGGFFKNYDIVHAHIFPTSYIVALAKVIFKPKCKFVFTEHNSYNRRAKNFIFSKLETLMYDKFDLIVGINDKLLNFLSKTRVRIDNRKLVTINNGVNLNKINGVVASSRKEFSLLETDIIVVMAARFALQKDHKTLIKAMKFLDDRYKLILCGDGVLFTSMKNFASECNLNENRVKFLGSRNDILNIIKMSDINVLSSHYEGFGLSIVEAMALGKPVIGSNVDGLSDVLANAGLTFEVGDEVTLANHIKKIGEEEEYYKYLSSMSLKKAQVYDIQVMVDKYLGFYSSLLEKK